MLSEAQQKNYGFFSEHLDEYLKDNLIKGKYAIFYDESIKGVYDSFDSAFSAACGQFPIGEFIVQQIVDSSEIVEFLRSAVV